MGIINASDTIMFKNHRKLENMDIKEIFLHKAQSIRLFWYGIHSFLRRADASGSADIIYRT